MAKRGSTIPTSKDRKNKTSIVCLCQDIDHVVTYPSKTPKRQPDGEDFPYIRTSSGEIVCTSGEFPVCPLHGIVADFLPDDEDEAEEALSLEADSTETWSDMSSDEHQPLQGGFTVTKKKKLSKRKKKARKSAMKSLTKLRLKIERETEAVEERRGYLDSVLHMMDAKQEKILREMEGHVTKLHAMIDRHHELARKHLHEEQERYYHQILVEMVELDNFSSELSSLRSKEEENVSSLTESDAADDLAAKVAAVPTLHNAFHALVGKRPTLGLTQEPVYEIVVPQMSDEDISSLVRCFTIRDKDCHAPTSSKAPEKTDSTASDAAETLKPAQLKGATMFFSSATLGGPPREKSATPTSDATPSSYPKPTPAESSAPEPGKKAKKKTVKQAASSVLADEEPPKPTVLLGRGKQPSAMAVRPDGKLLIVYAHREPCLDLLDSHGNILKTVRVAGNATGVAPCQPKKSVFLVSQFGLTVMDLPQDDSSSGVTVTRHELNFNPTSVASDKTGCVVSGKRCLVWFDSKNETTQWIVPSTRPYLKKVCATAVLMYKGARVVCAADRVGCAVHFYVQSKKPGRFPRMFSFSSENLDSSPGQLPFVPVSLSVHPSGYVGVLNSASESVILLTIQSNVGVPVFVIPRRRLCDGVPAVIAFDPNVSDKPRLWVASTSGTIARSSVVM